MTDLFAMDALSTQRAREEALPGYPCVISPDGLYRYTLWRAWGDGPRPSYMMMIGLNPSTADAHNDDPTIRRCVAFAKAEGFGALCMVNLFAYRATDPRVMKAAPDPAGPDNLGWLGVCAFDAGQIVAAWGTGGDHLGQADKVVHCLTGAGYTLHCLGTTKDGRPRHPLYLPKTARPIPYTGASPVQDQENPAHAQEVPRG